MIFGLVLAWPADRKARRILEDGRRVRGAEMVTRDEFNQRRKYNLGIGFKTLEKPSLREKLWIKYPYGPMIVIPEWDEPKHFLLMGDTGSGKSALMRQILWQLTRQQETAIVYDPAREYVERFYNPERGDIILNPLDARAPYWNPGDELDHDAEARTIAESVFRIRRTSRRSLRRRRGKSSPRCCAPAWTPGRWSKRCATAMRSIDWWKEQKWRR